MSLLTEGQLREIVALKAYRDPAFRRQLLTSPKATVEAIIGLSLGDVRVSIIEDNEHSITMVIPPVSHLDDVESEMETETALPA